MSPGVSVREPALQAAAARGVRIIGDIELFARAADAPVVAITGSNGKSTVTSLVSAMAKRGGVRAGSGGNLGPPALSLLRPGLRALRAGVVQLPARDHQRTASRRGHRVERQRGPPGSVRELRRIRRGETSRVQPRYGGGREPRRSPGFTARRRSRLDHRFQHTGATRRHGGTSRGAGARPGSCGGAHRSCRSTRSPSRVCTTSRTYSPHSRSARRSDWTSAPCPRAGRDLRRAAASLRDGRLLWRRALDQRLQGHQRRCDGGRHRRRRRARTGGADRRRGRQGSGLFAAAGARAPPREVRGAHRTRRPPVSMRRWAGAPRCGTRRTWPPPSTSRRRSPAPATPCCSLQPARASTCSRTSRRGATPSGRSCSRGSDGDRAGGSPDSCRGQRRSAPGAFGHRYDAPFILAVAAVLALGLVMVASASTSIAARVYGDPPRLLLAPVDPSRPGGRSDGAGNADPDTALGARRSRPHARRGDAARTRADPRHRTRGQRQHAVDRLRCVQRTALRVREAVRRHLSRGLSRTPGGRGPGQAVRVPQAARGTRRGLPAAAPRAGPRRHRRAVRHRAGACSFSPGSPS